MSTSVMREHRVEHASGQLTRGLATDVEQAIWNDPRLRSTDSQLGVQATAEGVVTLTGHVRGDMLKAVAGKRAGQVLGVRQVVNGLVADTDLENEIALALAMDPTVATCTDQLTVKVILGTALVSGTVRAADQAAADAALEQVRRLTLSVAGVREALITVQAAVGETAAAPTESAADSEMATDDSAAAMAARLAVWRERAAAKGA